MDERGARLERLIGEVEAGERVEQLAERLDLLGKKRHREQPLELRGDAEVGGGAREELAHHLALVVALERRRERVADGLERAPPRVAEHPNGYSHDPLLARESQIWHTAARPCAQLVRLAKVHRAGRRRL